jgi:mono/diheme cytochrome c family protein
MAPKSSQLRAAFILAGPFALLTCAWGLRAGAGPEAVPAGKKLYLLRCAGCHGAKGEGGKGYPKPLTGTRSPGELARFIAQSMPPGPRKCPAPDAQRIAAYISDAFYSPVAQARNKPARIALSRLTVRQFRNAVTDLIGSFRPAASYGTERGLHGEYYKDRRFEANERLLERQDAQVQFDFGTDGPIPQKFDPHHFSIRWEGSVLAPDTGEYEFIVHTEHAVRLWVDGGRQPLIDAWVKSGNETEYRGVITLLGGRAYPLRLEFSKSTQGVDDSAQKKGKPAPKASIALLWRRPKETPEIIPQRCLLPVQVPETYVVGTPFPPDDRSIGYERGISVSKDWDDAVTDAALEAAHYVTERLTELSGVAANAPDRPAQLQAFCRRFVERAFRRPLTPDVEQLYITRQFQATADPEQAVKRVVALTLQSPRFLYREAGSTRPDSYDVASRLSFGLWDSLPDQELLRAAAAGELATRDQVARQAARMAADTRAWNKLREFLLLWLKMDQTPELVKSKKRYPDFDPDVATDLRTSMELFLESAAWGERADYRDVMLSPKLFLNGRLARLYGVSLPADAPFQPVAANPAERCGVLTQPYLLSCFAYLDTGSPIHRGVLIARNLLGRTLQPPPAAFAPLAADLHPDMTTRQRVSLQTRPAFCNGCHGLINPLGFTLERYDAIGKIQERENGHPIDATGSYEARNGQHVTFNGAQDMARYLADSDEAHAAFVEKLFQHLVKQPVRAYGAQTLPDLEHSFADNEYNIRKLMVQIMVDSALQPTQPNQSPSHPAIRVGELR